MHPDPDPYGQRPSDPTAPPPPPDPYAPPYGSGPGQPHDPYAPQPDPYAPQPDPYAPQPDPYGGTPMYPNAGPPFPPGRQNALGLVAMILGIASVPLACCYLGLPLGIGALVTGWLGKQKADQGLADNGGQALAGLVCGAIGAVVGLARVGLTFRGFLPGN